MKKFLIAAVSLILLSVILYAAYYQAGAYIDLDPDAPISTFASCRGQEILVDTGAGLEPYEIKGVDMGVGIPGHFATDHAIDRDTYLRWFGLIQEMGANTIRVYTIQPTSFYDAFYEYNSDNADPLYLIHGVWVDDYIQNSHVDALDDSFCETFEKNCKAMVDVIHGRRRFSLGYGAEGATGSFTKDISPWVLGYILGVEWEDVTVAYTDEMKTEYNSYTGDYMYTTEEATPFEAMLAGVGDQVIAYESGKYKEQRLLAFANWPTTDPLEYPDEVDRLFMKCASVDVEHIRTTDAFLSGQFASYHVYSYYPDYLEHYDSWKAETPYAEEYRLGNGAYNTYGIYLKKLTQHHKMPVVISEFGVPTSRGRAQLDYNTARSQGYMSEAEQGEAIRTEYDDIKQAGCAGAIIFTWQDEWFKRTWNTMAYSDLTKTPYWSDVQTNEQYFGLLSFDPGKEESVCYTDGDVGEWSDADLLTEEYGCRLFMKYDEKFLYFRIHKDKLDLDRDTIYIPLDITPKSGSYYAQEERIKFDRRVDFLIKLHGKNDSKVMVQEYYNPFTVVFNEAYGGKNPFFEPPMKDSPVFEPIYLALQLGSVNAVLDNDRMSEKFETGKLTYGNGNPDDSAYDSVSDYICRGDEIEMRIPWGLLNFSNPSERQIHDDYYENHGIENLKIKNIYAGVGMDLSQMQRIHMSGLQLKSWGRNPTWHERLKKSYYVVQDMWREDVAE